MSINPNPDRLEDLRTEYAQTGMVTSDGAVWLFSQVVVLREQVQHLKASSAVSVVPPATNQTALRDRIAVLRWAADELGRMDYDTDSNDYGYDTYRDAWNGGVMDGADLLRRLAAEAAVVPPPALTEEGRLRAQVEVLQQDAERDRGLAKVGARCMRVGHQGLIEQGRLVLEGWRFALSTALGLGTGAPWEAIHDRAKELAAEAPHTATPDAPAVVAQPGKGTDTGARIVAHVLATHTDLHCLRCATPPLGDIWTPVTADELDDGGVCARCGADVLIPQDGAQP